MPVVIKCSPHSRDHKNMPFVHFAHSWHRVLWPLESWNSRKIFYKHRHNILIHLFVCTRQCPIHKLTKYTKIIKTNPFVLPQQQQVRLPHHLPQQQVQQPHHLPQQQLLLLSQQVNIVVHYQTMLMMSTAMMKTTMLVVTMTEVLAAPAMIHLDCGMLTALFVNVWKVKLYLCLKHMAEKVWI